MYNKKDSAMCSQYPISNHMGYNNSSGLIFTRQNGKSQYEGTKPDFDMTQLPEPEYKNKEAISNEQKQFRNGTDVEKLSAGTQEQVSTVNLHVEDGGVFGLQKLVTKTNNLLTNDSERIDMAEMENPDVESKLYVDPKFAPKKERKGKGVKMSITKY